MKKGIFCEFKTIVTTLSVCIECFYISPNCTHIDVTYKTNFVLVAFVAYRMLECYVTNPIPFFQQIELQCTRSF